MYQIPKVEWKTVWILISWLHQKPADLDQQCFKKMNRIPGTAGQWLKEAWVNSSMNYKCAECCKFSMFSIFANTNTIYRLGKI